MSGVHVKVSTLVCVHGTSVHVCGLRGAPAFGLVRDSCAGRWLPLTLQARTADRAAWVGPQNER